MSERVHPFHTGECDNGELHGQPGPNPVPRPLPALDPNAYPVYAGPPAFLPSEPASPGIYEGKGVWTPLPDRIEAPEGSMYARKKTGQTKEVWPAPESVNTDVHPAEYKDVRAVGGMVKAAEAQGWHVRVTRARGSYPSVGQKPSRQRTSLAVRMSRGLERAVAVYVEPPSEGRGTWSWDTLSSWIVGEFPTKYPDVTTFKKAVL